MLSQPTINTSIESRLTGWWQHQEQIRTLTLEFRSESAPDSGSLNSPSPSSARLFLTDTRVLVIGSIHCTGLGDTTFKGWVDVQQGAFDITTHHLWNHKQSSPSSNTTALLATSSLPWRLTARAYPNQSISWPQHVMIGWWHHDIGIRSIDHVKAQDMGAFMINGHCSSINEQPNEVNQLKPPIHEILSRVDQLRQQTWATAESTNNGAAASSGEASACMTDASLASLSSHFDRPPQCGDFFAGVVEMNQQVDQVRIVFTNVVRDRGSGGDDFVLEGTLLYTGDSHDCQYQCSMRGWWSRERGLRLCMMESVASLRFLSSDWHGCCCSLPTQKGVEEALAMKLLAWSMRTDENCQRVSAFSPMTLRQVLVGCWDEPRRLDASSSITTTGQAQGRGGQGRFCLVSFSHDIHHAPSKHALPVPNNHIQLLRTTCATTTLQRDIFTPGLDFIFRSLPQFNWCYNLGAMLLEWRANVVVAVVLDSLNVPPGEWEFLTNYYGLHLRFRPTSVYSVTGTKHVAWLDPLDPLDLRQRIDYTRGVTPKADELTASTSTATATSAAVTSTPPSTLNVDLQKQQQQQLYQNFGEYMSYQRDGWSLRWPGQLWHTYWIPLERLVKLVRDPSYHASGEEFSIAIGNANNKSDDTTDVRANTDTLRWLEWGRWERDRRQGEFLVRGVTGWLLENYKDGQRIDSTSNDGSQSGRQLNADELAIRLDEIEKQLTIMHARFLDQRKHADEIVKSVEERAAADPILQQLLSDSGSLVPPSTRSVMVIPRFNQVFEGSLYDDEHDAAAALADIPSASVLHTAMRNRRCGFGRTYAISQSTYSVVPVSTTLPSANPSDSRLLAPGHTSVVPSVYLQSEGGMVVGKLHGWTSQWHQKNQCYREGQMWRGLMHGVQARWWYTEPTVAPSSPLVSSSSMGKWRQGKQHGAYDKVWYTTSRPNLGVRAMQHADGITFGISVVWFTKCICIQRCNADNKVVGTPLWLHPKHRVPPQPHAHDPHQLRNTGITIEAGTDKYGYAALDSSHPMVCEYMSVAELMRSQIDVMHFDWLQSAARFDLQRRQFDRLQPRNPLVDTGHFCDGCSCQLMLGDHWQCRLPECALDLCTQCKTHMPSPSSESDNNQPRRLPVWMRNHDDITHGPLQLYKFASSDSQRDVNHPPPPLVPTFIDFSSPFQREARIIGPMFHASLATALATVNSTTASASQQRRIDPSPSITASDLPFGPHQSTSGLRESLLSSSERLAEAKSDSTISNDNIAATAAAASLPVSYSALGSELSRLLRLSTDLLTHADSASIIAARPELHPDGTSVHISSPWLQLLSDPTTVAAATGNGPLSHQFTMLRTPASESRRHYHLLLLSRVQSMHPLFVWWHQRVLAQQRLMDSNPSVTATSHPSIAVDDIDPNCPPLNLELSSLAALLAILQHIRVLYGQVKLEVSNTLMTPVISDNADSSSSWTSRIRNWLKLEPPLSQPQRKDDSRPAIDLWLRLVESADLARAAVQYREPLKDTPKHIVDAAANLRGS